MNFYTGCPIWSFKGWVGNFYPKGTKSGEFLHEYTRRLTTVEGNTTFYAVPSRETIQGWAVEMVEGFRFCPKLPRTISHSGKISEHIEEAFAFVKIMTWLGSNLTPIDANRSPISPFGSARSSILSAYDLCANRISTRPNSHV